MVFIKLFPLLGNMVNLNFNLYIERIGYLNKTPPLDNQFFGVPASFCGVYLHVYVRFDSLCCFSFPFWLPLFELVILMVDRRLIVVLFGNI